MEKAKRESFLNTQKPCRFYLKLDGVMDVIIGIKQEINQVVIEGTGDPKIKILGTKEGCVIIEFEGSLEGFKRLESKIKSGELTEILGFPILEVQQIDELASSDAADIGFKFTQWFDNIKINDWVSEIGMQASRLVKELNKRYDCCCLKR